MGDALRQAKIFGRRQSLQWLGGDGSIPGARHRSAGMGQAISRATQCPRWRFWRDLGANERKVVVADGFSRSLSSSAFRALNRTFLSIWSSPEHLPRPPDPRSGRRGPRFKSGQPDHRRCRSAGASALAASRLRTLDGEIAVCFHYEFEHDPFDPDEECTAGGCPSAAVNPRPDRRPENRHPA